jgi:hypothetical protein
MKIRSSDQQPGQGLPPAPAPTARDANPWQMSAGAGGKQHEPRHPRAPGWPPRPRTPQQVAASRKQGMPWIPLLILFFIAGTVMQFAVQALRHGDFEAAVAAILMLLLVAFVALRRIRKGRG